MTNGKLFFYQFMRDLVEWFYPRPSWWLFWDEKVLAERKVMKRG